MQEFRRVEAHETEDLLHAGGDGLRGLPFVGLLAGLGLRPPNTFIKSVWA